MRTWSARYKAADRLADAPQVWLYADDEEAMRVFPTQRADALSVAQFIVDACNFREQFAGAFKELPDMSKGLKIAGLMLALYKQLPDFERQAFILAVEKLNAAEAAQERPAGALADLLREHPEGTASAPITDDSLAAATQFLHRR